MAADISRRCGCREDVPDGNGGTKKGRQLGNSCPLLAADPKHGSWGYYVDAGKDPRTGKRVQHRKFGFRTEREARIERNKVAVKVDQGTFVRPSRQSVAEYLSHWLPRRQRTGKGLKPTTVSNYTRYIEKDITPTTLGVMKLTDVRRDHVNRFVAELMDDGRGAVTIHRIAAVLKTAFESAVQDGMMENNPAARVDLPTIEDNPVEVWDPTQLESFLEVAAGHRLGALFELVTFTGLRRGEVTGLLWEDVDLVAAVLHVRNTRVQVDGKVVDQTTAKNRSSRRTVELDDASVGALMAWKIQQEAEAETWADLWEDSGRVFTMDNGRPIQPTYVTRLFEKLRKLAKAPKLTLHGLRHEHASLLAASGADVLVISKRLGHSTIATTSNVYGHMLPNVSRSAAEGASSLVRRKAPVVPTLHSQGGSGDMENAPAGTANGSDKGV